MAPVAGSSLSPWPRWSKMTTVWSRASVGTWSAKSSLAPPNPCTSSSPGPLARDLDRELHPVVHGDPHPVHAHARRARRATPPLGCLVMGDGAPVVARSAPGWKSGAAHPRERRPPRRARLQGAEPRRARSRTGTTCSPRLLLDRRAAVDAPRHRAVGVALAAGAARVRRRVPLRTAHRPLPRRPVRRQRAAVDHRRRRACACRARRTRSDSRRSRSARSCSSGSPASSRCRCSCSSASSLRPSLIHVHARVARAR